MFYIDQDLKHEAELDAVEARISACEKCIGEQQARIAWLSENGLDTALSLRLLVQLEFSLRLLTNTRDLIRCEMQGIKAPGARPVW